MNKEITVSDFINLANNCVGEGLLVTGERNFSLAKSFAKQEKAELLNEVKEVREFFKKGSPLTNMLDKIIEKHS